PARFTGERGSFKLQAAAALPDREGQRTSPGELPHVANQSFIQNRVGLEGEHVSFGADEAGCDHAVVSDMGPDIQEGVAFLEQRLKAPAQMVLITATPHLPFNPVAQVDLKSRPDPQRKHCPPRAQAAGDLAERINEPGPARKRSHPESKTG